MVSINWTGGRTGNDLFEYVFARIIAVISNLHLETEWPHPDFVKFHPFVGGEKHDSPVVNIGDMYKDRHDVNWFLSSYSRKRIIVKGFFQHVKYYDPNRKLIETFFNLPDIEPMPDKDIVMHYRLGDYYKVGNNCNNCTRKNCYNCKGGSVIHPSWYLKILKQLRLNPSKQKLYIVTDDPNDPILDNFKQYIPVIVHQSPSEDFHFIRRFKTILCGNSSFSFWASWLSKAEKIFTFSKWMHEPHGHIIRLANFKGSRPMNGEWL